METPLTFFTTSHGQDWKRIWKKKGPGRADLIITAIKIIIHLGVTALGQGGAVATTTRGTNVGLTSYTDYWKNKKKCDCSTTPLVPICPDCWFESKLPSCETTNFIWICKVSSYVCWYDVWCPPPPPIKRSQIFDWCFPQRRRRAVVALTQVLFTAVNKQNPAREGGRRLAHEKSSWKLIWWWTWIVERGGNTDAELGNSWQSLTFR